MGPGPPLPPPRACSPNDRDDPQDSLEDGQEAEGQEEDLGARATPQGQSPFLMTGLELLPLEEEASVTDPPTVITGAWVPGGF